MNYLTSITGKHFSNPTLAVNSAREIMQEIVLCGLYRANFFNHVAFHGGTSLRLFHGLDRFSEDLDFCIVDDGFEVNFDKISSYVENEIKSFGLDYSITKVKGPDAFIQGCYVEGNAVDTLREMGYSDEELTLIHPRTKLKVKMDVDRNTPKGFRLDHLYKGYPFQYGITLLDIHSLFAGKTSAVITRHWKNRVKGRDLYDFEWYINNKIPVNMDYLESNLVREGLVQESELDRDMLLELLANRFNALDYKSALSDLSMFVQNVPDNWCPEHFIELSKDILIKDYGSPE
ncbi:hypothetical protein AUP07_0049 [methanogenic archaeon mixed culture ISO4-G1]|nr:hypothetical protein AUP07_0049 [methanogenic archaeon mixed culture ISO4-G1]